MKTLFLLALVVMFTGCATVKDPCASYADVEQILSCKTASIPPKKLTIADRVEQDWAERRVQIDARLAAARRRDPVLYEKLDRAVSDDIIVVKQVKRGVFLAK